jgi:hypothetical protein
MPMGNIMYMPNCEGGVSVVVVWLRWVVADFEDFEIWATHIDGCEKQ